MPLHRQPGLSGIAQSRKRMLFGRRTGEGGPTPHVGCYALRAGTARRTCLCCPGFAFFRLIAGGDCGMSDELRDWLREVTKRAVEGRRVALEIRAEAAATRARVAETRLQAQHERERPRALREAVRRPSPLVGDPASENR